MKKRSVLIMSVCLALIAGLGVLLLCRSCQAREQDAPAATETPLYTVQPQPMVTPTPTHTPRPTVPPESDTASSHPTPRRSISTSKKSTVTADPYDVYDYADPEEFYYYNYDDFYDYYDAEDYYNDYMD